MRFEGVDRGEGVLAVEERRGWCVGSSDIQKLDRRRSEGARRW
jgi:hypothetical protein